MLKWKPSQIPKTVTPDGLHEIAGIDWERLQERIREGCVPLNPDGTISRKNAIALLRAFAREDAEAERSQDAQERAKADSAAAPPPQAKNAAQRALETSQRLARVSDLLAQMVPAREIRERLAAQWGVCPSTVENYIALAYQDLAKLGQLGKSARKDQLRDAFSEFYRAALDIGDFRSASVALDRLAKIEGAYEPEKIDVSGSVGETLNNPSNIRDRMAKLLENPELLSKIVELTK